MPGDPMRVHLKNWEIQLAQYVGDILDQNKEAVKRIIHEALSEESFNEKIQQEVRRNLDEHIRRLVGEVFIDALYKEEGGVLLRQKLRETVSKHLSDAMIGRE
jgi:flagellar basal body-associated protein FliL